MDAYEFRGDWSGQLIASAIHAGHDLRPEVADLMILDEADRLREEDPHTDRIAARAPAQIVVHRSRFEMDLNRVREKTVYRSPADCWDLDVWSSGSLPDDVVERSLEEYDSFFAALAERLDEVAARGPFVLYDIHSYNHRRDGADAEPAPAEENPEVNLGTGSVDHVTFGAVVGAFRQTMLDEGFDVRDNVKFLGQNLAWFVHGRYPGVGCVLAIEFKKTFMDEWTGEVDEDHLTRLGDAIEKSFGPVLEAMPR